MSEIKNKQEFYKLYNKGLLGNRALNWESFKELKQSSWRGNVCIRGTGIPRVAVKYNIPFYKIREEIKDLREKGYPEKILRFNQSMPDSNLTIQGEVMDYINGFELTYSTIKAPMIQALKKEEKIAQGLVAKIMLKTKMDLSSFEDLNALLELYPNCVVEFSTYDVNVGEIKSRNTIFWEVRNY